MPRDVVEELLRRIRHSNESVLRGTASKETAAGELLIAKESMSPAHDPLLMAIIGNWVGDYLLQNDWMAQNKRRSGFVCAAHCIVWTFMVCSFSGWWTPAAVAVLFGSHFLQDRTPVISWFMRVNGQTAFRDGPCSPWAAIVVDNVFHIVTLLFVADFVV